MEAQTPPWAWKLQAPPAQIPEQLWLACDAQSPAPSHFDAGVSMVDGLQLPQTAAWHWVPDGHFAHCPDSH